MRRIIPFLVVMVMSAGVPGVSSAGANPSATIESVANPLPESGGRYGAAVEGLDDIDGDGVGDLAVGAHETDRVFLFSGDDRSLIRTLAHPTGLTGLRFGLSVRGVGDLDGDAVQDIAVGTPGPFAVFPSPCNPLGDECPTGPGPEHGQVHLFSGADGTFIATLSPDPLSPPFDQYFEFGAAVAPLGDVNADGVPDIGVGAPAHWYVTSAGSGGSVYAFSGADGGQLWATTEFPMPRPLEEQLPSLGAYLAETDDLDGDGVGDLLASAAAADVDPDPANQVFGGRGYVLSGASGTIFRTHNAAPSPGAGFGEGPGVIGDQDGDGLPEYVFGDEGDDKIRVFRGSDGSLVRVIDSPVGGGDGFGRFVAGVDDMDADGRDDFWVSASGIAYLMNQFGDVIEQVDLSPGDIGMFEGRALSTTADLDGDGSRDVIVGKPFDPDGSGLVTGAAFLIFVPPLVAVCPQGQGFWYHGTGPWPANTVEVGKETYNEKELRDLGNLRTKGDATLALSRNLVAAKLNIESGVGPGPIRQTILAADALLESFSGKLPYGVKASTDDGAQMVALSEFLDNYNNGLFTDGCS